MTTHTTCAKTNATNIIHSRFRPHSRLADFAMRILLLLLASLGHVACSVAALTVSRRAVALSGALAVFVPRTQSCEARTPGSTDVGEAIQQIIDGRSALRRLQLDWTSYACIDKEGRACNIDTARKILGGVAPQRGDRAVTVALSTPLCKQP
jgi:hypothetical protein